MLSLCVLMLVIISTVSTGINKKQLNGLKNLIKHIPSGVYPTCNIVIFSELVDYDTADEQCKSFDLGTGVAYEGNLATVNDAEKNEDLKMLLELAYPYSKENNKWGPMNWVWVGLRKVTNLTDARKTPYEHEQWEWADGSNPSEYEKWMQGQPDQRALRKNKNGCNESPKCYQNQMRINHAGKWDDTFKHKLHPYACDYRGKYIVSPDKKTWWKAKEACEDAGLILAKVTSRAELDELINIAVYVLGETDEELRVFHPDNWFWIGGNDLNEEAVWRWTDGEDVEDWGIPWRNPNPDNARFALAEGQNVMSVSKWGQFDDSFELKKKRAFACQCIQN